MNNIDIDNRTRIVNLKKEIGKKIKENNRLNIQENNLRQQTLKYQDIFNNTYISIWEENPTEVYKIIDSLPCRTGFELSEYLISNKEILNQMVTQLIIEEINNYTFLLFGASTKAEFSKTLKKGTFLTPEAFSGSPETLTNTLEFSIYANTI